MRKRIFTMLLVVLSALFLVSCAYPDNEGTSGDNTQVSGEVVSLEIEASDTLLVINPVIEGGEGLFEYELNLADQSLTGDGRESASVECRTCEWGELVITPFAINGKGKRVYGEARAFVIENKRVKTPDELRYDNDKLLISTPAELILFSHAVSRGEDPSVLLENDISMGSAFTWRGIGSSEDGYSGIFDANGHTVSGLYILSSGKRSIGFFSRVDEDGEVRDLVIENSRVFANSNKYVGVIAGELYGKIIGARTDAFISTTSMSGYEGVYSSPSDSAVVGGIAGKIDGALCPLIKDARFEGKIDVSALCISSVGGIVGNAIGAFFGIEESSFTSEIRVRSRYFSERIGAVSIGGICGSAYSGRIHACVSGGNIVNDSTVSASVGGIIGSLKGAAALTDCEFTSEGSIDTKDSYKSAVGGIAGSVSDPYSCGALVKRCASLGKLDISEGVAGGTIGYCDQLFFAESICFNGIITSGDTDSYSGSFIGCSVSGNNEGAIIKYSVSANALPYVGYSDGETGAAIYNCYNIRTDDTDAEEIIKLSHISDSFVYDSESDSLFLVWQKDASKYSDSITIDSYIKDSDAEENEKTDPLKIIGEIKDGENLFAADKLFEDECEKYTAHKIFDKDGEYKECNCSFFDSDHFFTKEEWQRIVLVIGENIDKVLKYTNYGQKKDIGCLTVDYALYKTETNAYCTRTVDERATCQRIAFNPSLFEKTESEVERIITHELSHAMSMDVGISNYLTEGYADFITYLVVGDARIDAYLPQKEDKRIGYTSCAAFYYYLYNTFGERGAILVREALVRGSGECLLSFSDCFGKSYSELWDFWCDRVNTDK